MSIAYATVATSPHKEEFTTIRLNRYGSKATRNRRKTLRVRVPEVSMGRTDIVSVYRSQMLIMIRKLKPKKLTLTSRS